MQKYASSNGNMLDKQIWKVQHIGVSDFAAALQIQCHF